MLKRTSPVVWNGNGPLDPEQVASYDKRGFLLARDLLNLSTISELQAEVERIAASEPRAGTILERDGVTVRSVFNVHNLSEKVSRDIAKNRRILDIAEQLLGPDLYVHQCHVNFKRPHTGGEYFWHSDFTFWYWEDGMCIPRAVSILLFLDNQRIETGPLYVVPGSHMWITHDKWSREVKDHSDAVKHDLDGDPAKNGLVDLETLRTLTADNEIEAILAKAGDVLFMDGNLVHASAPNLGCSSRRILLLILNSMANQIGTPFSGQPPRPEYISSRTFAALR
ncbi:MULTISPECIES: phytanoyl-CoA dioxygenase family protein [unclassified Bradyrhizobium]|uniref:phytanoyl-CoA dioxygenase family protein n=1 Tax=unclassified Bradyrhizobium TaxID=2631580 RepID=UPI0028E1FCD1|nr:MULTISPECIES: phytanoyl-CoA dioxygenase family protein [unclassified Bradyrhizobium]